MFARRIPPPFCRDRHGYQLSPMTARVTRVSPEYELNVQRAEAITYSLVVIIFYAAIVLIVLGELLPRLISISRLPRAAAQYSLTNRIVAIGTNMHRCRKAVRRAHNRIKSKSQLKVTFDTKRGRTSSSVNHDQRPVESHIKTEYDDIDDTAVV